MEETRRILETMAKEYPKIAEGMGVVSQDEFIAAYKVSKESTSLSPSDAAKPTVGAAIDAELEALRRQMG